MSDTNQIRRMRHDDGIICSIYSNVAANVAHEDRLGQFHT